MTSLNGTMITRAWLRFLKIILIRMPRYPSNRVLLFLHMHILVVGCGNSNLCEDMAYRFKGPIEGIDISPTVIEEMKKKHQQKAEQM